MFWGVLHPQALPIGLQAFWFCIKDYINKFEKSIYEQLDYYGKRRPHLPVKKPKIFDSIVEDRSL